MLIIVENLPCPFDRRVWQEATTLARAGVLVSIICPKGRGFEKSREEIDGIVIYRHAMPVEASGAWGYAVEYAWALLAQFALSLRVLAERGFDALHACNPPDTIF
ncbi:MAG TPA: glycosyltransferase WbuB, partial [Steroidobacteraceae bacterium]|nr:glycosyltransferase WbuB [Steroidobacteraceae bacterium]